MRAIKDLWFRLVMGLTGFAPDIKHVLVFRGFLLRPSFRTCGRNFQIACDVRVSNPHNVLVGKDVFLSGGAYILAGAPVTLEDEVMLGPYAVVVSGDHSRVGRSWRFGPPDRGEILLKRGSWVGAHAVVTKGVTMGVGSCLAAGAVAIEDVPDDSIAGGVPARVIKRMEERR